MYYLSKEVTSCHPEGPVLYPGLDFNTPDSIQEVESLIDPELRKRLEEENVAVFIHDHERIPQHLIGTRTGTTKMTLADGTSVIYLDRKSIKYMDVNRTIRHELAIK